MSERYTFLRLTWSPATRTSLQGSEARAAVRQTGLPLVKAVVGVRPTGLP